MSSCVKRLPFSAKCDVWIPSSLGCIIATRYKTLVIAGFITYRATTTDINRDKGKEKKRERERERERERQKRASASRRILSNTYIERRDIGCHVRAFEVHSEGSLSPSSLSKWPLAASTATAASCRLDVNRASMRRVVHYARPRPRCVVRRQRRRRPRTSRTSSYLVHVHARTHIVCRDVAVNRRR